MRIGNTLPFFSLLIRTLYTAVPNCPRKKLEGEKVLVICQVPQEGRVWDLRQNGILKTDTLDKANICNRQFESAFTLKSPQKEIPFTHMGEITVDPKGVLKLLNNLYIH